MDSPEEEAKDSNIDSLSFKEQENENYPLKTMEIIDNVSDKIEQKTEEKQKNDLKILLIIISFIFIFIIMIYLIKSINNKNNIHTSSELFKFQPQNISELMKSQDDENKKINVAFIYPSLTGNGISRFMVVTGEYLIRTGKYNVYFFTKDKSNKELSYNENIKRIYCYSNSTLIKRSLKNEKIDFLVINNLFSANTIKWYKSLGIKVIGIFHGVYMSPMFNNSTMSYRNWKNLDLYDAFIHIAADDYFYYTNFGFNRNIFIPNLYTFEPGETPSSNLTNHNIMMLGRLNDKKKGLIYALKAMTLIVKEIPDARLNLVSSDGNSKELKRTLDKLNLTNNVFYIPFTPQISEHFLNSSVFFFTSLTEAFPMALNEAKAYGLPCVTFDVSYSIPFQSGVIKVETFDYKSLAREVVKLLNNYEYRIKMGKEAKLSLNKFTNEGTIKLWGRLFDALKNGEDEYQKLRKEIENKYYNKEIAEKHMEKQFEYLKMYNKFFRCHSLKNLTNINYINSIEVCSNI